MIAHLGISGATKSPEMELDKSEADALAQATTKVMQEFDVRPDPKFIAIAGLVTTAGSIYGPRVILIRERRKQERKEKANQVPANIEQFGGGFDVPPNALGG